jgi:hypothetical protein
MAEIQKFDETSVSGPNVTHDIRWLRAGRSSTCEPVREPQYCPDEAQASR